MPRTSIIIPTHDRPHLLRRAMKSAQSAGSEIEVIVVDDGSTDETSTVCASFDDVITVRLDHRQGVGHARAAGVAASSGAFITFLDDDDVRLPGSVDRQAALLESNRDAALVYGQSYRAGQDLVVDEHRLFPQACPTGDVFWTLIGSNFMPSGTVLVRRSAIDAVGGLFPQAAPADDWDLWLRIAERYPVAALVEPVSVYREATLWSKQGSSRIADGLLHADLRALKRCATLPRAIENPRAFRRAERNLKSIICNRLLGETIEAARRGDWYAFVSLRHAMMTPRAFVRALFSPAMWRKMRERLRS